MTINIRTNVEFRGRGMINPLKTKWIKDQVNIIYGGIEFFNYPLPHKCPTKLKQ
jgi:hypothetical protein